MTADIHAEAELLAADVAATAAFSIAAARLLVRLVGNGPLAADAVGEREARRALAELALRGAAETVDGVVTHRPRSWWLGRVGVRGVRLCVETCGQGDPLLLAAPFGTYRCLWGNPWDASTGQLARFADTHRTLCVDYRGTGCSDITPEAYSLDGFAADLDAVLDHLGIARVHLLGVSMGGAVVLRMALACPARVASLVLCATTARELDVHTRRKGAEFLAVMREHPLDWALRTYLRTPITGATPATTDALLALGRRSARTRDNFANLYRANVLRGSVADRLGGLRVPTLVLVGADDLPYFHEQARDLARAIAGAELVTIAASAHLPCAQNPAVFNEVVLDFLARHALARASAGGSAIAAEA